MVSSSIKQLGLALLLCCVSTLAAAQYIWLDSNGVKQYSDRPPPPDVPPMRIIKGMGPAPAAAAAPPDPATAPTRPPETAKPKNSLADRNADFNKRRNEQAEKDKKAGAEAQAASEQKANCERARDYSTTLANGNRLTRPDANGEPAVMTEEQRAQETVEVRKILAQCK
jgi:type IV secretory pathway VirB10-like protein